MISSDHDFNQQKFLNDFNIICNEKAHVCGDLDDTNNLQSSFSIRDYVFSSRRKDIACNWPFSTKTLQICLQNGVKNLLPPFQSLEPLRNNQDLTLESRKTITAESGQRKSIKPVPISTRKTQPAIKKFKIGPIEEVSLMASFKICPVCETFSSSSNTTLNAHIDQCLCGEPNIKWTPKPKTVAKNRIKPRKMRLMVNIYKTAPKCTIEELDARNGTSNWANNSSFPTQELEFHTEETTIVREVVDREKDVYIDNDGTKIRILSVPKVDIQYDHEAQKRLKGGKLSKSFIGKMKKNKNQEHRIQHEHGYLKINPKNKTFEVASGHGVTVGIGEKEQMQPKLRKKMDDFPIVRPPWACSKRSRLSQHLRHNTTNNLSVTNDKYVSEFGLKQTRILSQQNKQKLETSPVDYHAKKRLKRSDFKSNGSNLSSSDGKLLSVNREKLKFQVESTNGKPFSEKQQNSYLVSEKLQQNTVQSSEEQHYHDTVDHDFMSDSPISTVSNPALTKSGSDKFSVNEKSAINYGYLRSIQARVFKNDHTCCCSRKETAFSQIVNSNYQELFNLRPNSQPPAPVPAPATLKYPAYSESDSIGSPSKPVIRLMGKNLTVDVQNPPNNLRNQALGTRIGNKIDDEMMNGVIMRNGDPPETVHNRSVSGYPLSQSLTAFSNGGFRAFVPFMEVGNGNYAKWSYTKTSSSAVYYAPRFS